MFKRVTLLLFFLFLVSNLFAQNDRYLLRPNGEKVKLDNNKNLREAIVENIKSSNSGQKVLHNFNHSGITSSSVGIPDTVGYSNLGSFNTNFGFYGQDYMMTWFEAPGDMIIKAAGYTTSDQEGVDEGLEASLRLVKLNWSAEKFRSFTDAAHLGFYPAEGDGFNNIGALPEEATGDFTFVGDETTLPWGDSFEDYDLWSDEGFGWPISPQASENTAKLYQWVEMAQLFEPTVQKGDIVGILLKHEGTVLDDPSTADDDFGRFGFWSDNSIGFPCLKYYENGRNDPGSFASGGDPGWWVRLYTWDFVLAVDIISDRPPRISDVTSLSTTVSQQPRTVEATIVDDNPSGGPAGVALAEVLYSVNGGEVQTVAMTEGTTDIYSAQIPGFSPGDSIVYSIRAVDVEGLESSADGSDYEIYLPTSGVNILVVVNGYSSEGRLAQLLSFYFERIGVIQNPYDLWYFGPVEPSLVNNYTSIIEIHMSEGSPTFDNRAVYSDWVASGNKNLLIAGQEQLGYLYGYANRTFEPGDFEYDVLGVLNSYNDLVASESDSTALLVQAGTALGDSLSLLMATLDPIELLYHPIGILGDANASNWIDQFDPRTDIENEVFMHGIGIEEDANENPVEVERPVGHNWTTPSGTKVVFMTYDPLALQNNDEDGTWVATSSSAPFHQAIRWFELDVVSVESEDSNIPKSFSIEQNYPNPFNPSTSISYSLPLKSDVTLRVYNTLGQVVTTLVDEEQSAGTHVVNFDLSTLSSGVYFYTINAGDFVNTKKMVLLK